MTLAIAKSKSKKSPAKAPAKGKAAKFVYLFGAKKADA